MGKQRKQRHILKRPVARPKARVTHLDSVEKISRFYQGLSSDEQDAMMQDAARWMVERDSYRIAAKDETLEPRFTFPEDTGRVYSLGCADGLRALYHILFTEFPDSPPPDELLQSVAITTPTRFVDMASGIAEMRSMQDARPIANSPELFDQYFTESFIAGFQFSLYALPRGLMKLYYSLPEDRGYELAHRFGWEHFVKEDSPDQDALITGALDQLKAMYEDYQAQAAG